MSTIEFPPAERVSLVGDFTRGELIGAGSATAVFGVGAMGGRLLAAIVVSAAILAWTFVPTRRRPLRIIVPAALRWRLRRDRTWSATIRPSASPPKLPSFLRGVDLEVVNGLDGSPVGVVANRDSYTVMFEVSRPALTYVSPAEQTHALAEWGEVLTGLCVERNSELVAERVGWTDVHRAADPAALQRHHVERGVAGPATADYEDYLGRFGTLAAHHEVVVWATVTRPGRFRVAKRLGLSGSPGEVMCAAAVHAGEALRTELAGRRFTTSPLWTPAQIGRSVTRALDPYGPLEALSERERFDLAERVGPESHVDVERDVVGVDRALHRVFAVTFPTTPVDALWMWQPLAVPGPKIVTTVFEPVAPSRADRERDSRRSVGTRNNRAAAGERDGHVKVGNLRKVDALHRAERAVADGHAELDGYCLVTISGRTRGELDRNCQRLRQAIRQAGRGAVRELSGNHDFGLAAALPIGAHVAVDQG